MKKQMHFGLFLIGTGSHVAGWRHPGAVSSFEDMAAVRRIAASAERGKFDLIFMGDNLNCDPKSHPSYASRLEPLTLLSALAGSTSRIGLGGTVSTTYSDPFSVARAFSSLDHLSNGRAAWNAVTTSAPEAAANFGTQHPDHARRYEMAGEFVDVVKGLWDCWADDAVVADRESGVYIDPAKVKPLDHTGEFFEVKGPLNISRAPQGHPIITQAGGSEPGQQLAARTADLVFAVVQDMAEAKASYASLKARLPAFGRTAEQVCVMPGVMPVVARTDREARDRLNELMSYVNAKNALGILSERFGYDMSTFDLDGPVPELPEADTYKAFTSVMLAKARREEMTLRDLYNLVAAARGHWVLCGSAEAVADTFQAWFEAGAADGFNVMPPYFHEAFDDFVDLVIPILQERGLFRADYEGVTLRDHLGLARPANPNF